MNGGGDEGQCFCELQERSLVSEIEGGSRRFIYLIDSEEASTLKRENASLYIRSEMLFSDGKRTWKKIISRFQLVHQDD